MPTARERNRAQTLQAITRAAQGQLVEHGAAGLSLRAVAREVGLVSSAVYRYFPSRDDLLTALIVAAYDDLGEHAESAVDPAEHPRRQWLAVWRAVRRWGVANPERWSLIYGSPVPGYTAPAATIPPAARVALTLIDVLLAARTLPEAADPAAAPDPAAVAAVDSTGIPGLAPELGPAAVSAWTQLIGTVSFELFGHYTGVVTDREAYLDHVADLAATSVGIPATTEPSRDRFRQVGAG